MVGEFGELEVEDSTMDFDEEMEDLQNVQEEEDQKVSGPGKDGDVKVRSLPESTTTLENLFEDPKIIQCLVNQMSVPELKKARLISLGWDNACISRLQEFTTKAIDNKFVKKIEINNSLYDDEKFDAFKNELRNDQLFTRFEFDYNFIQNILKCIGGCGKSINGDGASHFKIMRYLKKFKINKLSIVNISLENEKEKEKKDQDKENEKGNEGIHKIHKIDQSWEKVHQILQQYSPTIQSLKIWDVEKFEMSEKENKYEPIEFNMLEKLKVNLTYAQLTFPDEYYKIITSILNLAPKLKFIKTDKYPVNQDIFDMTCNSVAYKLLVKLDLESWFHCGQIINFEQHLEDLHLKELKVEKVENNYGSFNIFLRSQCQSLTSLYINLTTEHSPDRKDRITFPRFEKLQNLTLLINPSNNNKIWSDFIQPVNLGLKFPHLHTLKINKMDKFYHICIGESKTLQVLCMNVEYNQRIKYTQLKTWFPNIVEFTTKIKHLPQKGSEIPWIGTLRKLTLDFEDTDIYYMEKLDISHLTGLEIIRITDWVQYICEPDRLKICWKRFEEFLESLCAIEDLGGHLKWLLFNKSDALIHKKICLMKPRTERKLECKMSDFLAQNQIRFAFYDDN